jgi:hypothetical protein
MGCDPVPLGDRYPSHEKSEIRPNCPRAACLRADHLDNDSLKIEARYWRNVVKGESPDDR